MFVVLKHHLLEHSSRFVPGADTSTGAFPLVGEDAEGGGEATTEREGQATTERRSLPPVHTEEANPSI